MYYVPRSLFYKCIFLFSLLVHHTTSYAQGKVVINEFMAWSGSGGSCPANSEFIELMNFGPGPQNIGCYIVTNGTFAVTIPPGTVLGPGKYFVLAGEDLLAKGCANNDSAVRVDLNWNTCGCLVSAAPPTSDGYLTDGGGANEKVILLDPSGSVVDAVSRYPVPSSSEPLTSGGSGLCTTRSFDLDTMRVVYESIGEAQGTGNSYSRRVDGDCGWVKTPAISAGAPNKTGSSASATYSLSTISAADCDSMVGQVSIQVSASSVASLFPMSYTLGFDRDSNGVFDHQDTYLYGVDSSAPSIDVRNLAYGRYRMTVASALGCNLKTFDFFIFNCYGIVLSLKLTSFTYEGLTGVQRSFRARFAEVEGLKELLLEGAGDHGGFQPAGGRMMSLSEGTSFQWLVPPAPYSRYRLKMTAQNDLVSYSPEVPVPVLSLPMACLWPNPAGERLWVAVTAVQRGALQYTVIGNGGEVVLRGREVVPQGTSAVSIGTQALAPGLYFLKLEGPVLLQPVAVRFVK